MIECIEPYGKGSIWTKLFSLLLLSICAFYTSIAHADFPEEQPGSRAASLSYSAAALTDSWSLFYNQAGLGFVEYPWVGVHHENRFITPGLNFSAIGAILPVWIGSLGVSVKHLGFSQFGQTKFGLAYGMKLAPTLSAGVQLSAHHVFLAGEYGSALVLSAEAGIIYSPTDRINVGFHIVNPTRSKLLEEQRIPTLLNIGVAYQISEMVLVTSGVEKSIDDPFSFKAGVEFMPIKNLAFRTGMASNPSLISFGVGYQVASLQIDMAFTRHEILGYTPHFSIAYLFGRKLESSIVDENIR
jgi:hypothetical protein